MLVGPRPDFGQMAKTIASTEVAPEGGATEDGSYRWSELISTETVEDEIKRQARALADAAPSATAFKGGGYKQARESLSMLALLFRLAAEHDEQARWRDIAPELSSLFARAGANCKVGTDGAYREAAARSQDLTDLIRGGRPEVPEPKEDQLWSDMADRGPIMKRMEVARQKGLGPLLGGKASFSRNTDQARHEAQVLAVLAEIITRPEFTDAGDEEYDALAQSLRDAATGIARSADQDDYETARASLSRADKACSDCHDNYRG
jgi:hypothetical protein